jgi:Ca-activated chloride channel family protein
MTWQNSISTSQVVFVAAFVVLYIVYAWRTYRLAKVLQSRMGYIYFKAIIRFVYFGLILIAFLGPSFGRIKQEIKALGKDIVICVDLSESMNAYDIQPSRLEKVKYEIKALLRGLEGDRIALVVFSDEAFLQCPLTFDQAALSVFVETMSSQTLGGGGTDLSEPLRLGLEKLQKDTEAQNAKAILIISDGEDFEDTYAKVADEVANAGIKVFTLGVGTAEGGPIPDGRGFKTDNDGKQVISRINPAALSEIATTTGGRYYELSNQVNGFPALSRDLKAIEGRVVEVKKLDVAANKFTYALVLAVILLFIDVMVPVRVLRIKG